MYKDILNTLINNQDLINHVKSKDPISLVKRYKTKQDIEIIGLLVSSLSYGRQTVFMDLLEDILPGLSEQPYIYIKETEIPEISKGIRDFKYRFNTKADIISLLETLQRIYVEVESLEDLLSGSSVRESMSSLIERLREGNEANYLLPSPKDGSACKRLNMFFRWMVRKDDIDLGVWSKVDKKDLIIPLDVHVLRISQEIGITKRKDASWRTAEEITAKLRELDPKDPIKYDAVLCAAGIVGKL
jgi:uncharacterized protein (TIGR02757 family)